MASKLYNLARMTTATTGTGTITLGSAVSGYLTFALAGAANGDVVSYAIKDGANSEIGTGTYTSAGTTLTRTVTKSTNANAAISLSGAAEVFITFRAEDNLLGTTTNDNAAAGYIGEYISATLVQGSATALTTATSKDITSISLTAGDWDVWGNIASLSSGTITGWTCWISTTSATIPTVPNNGAYTVWLGSTTSNVVASAGMMRLSLSATTTVFLSVFPVFTSTVSGYGFIGARRVR
ncbi:MAG: putative rane-localized protein [Bradyrhizobium sp.]|nr:putative rane-localized protein [Bradyrhizobium sp.]